MLRSFWCRKWGFLSQKPVQVYSLCMPNISSFVSACVWHIGYYFVSYFHDALDQPNNYLIMSGLIISFICTKLLFSKNNHHIILFITLITTNTRYSGCLNNFSNKFIMVFYYGICDHMNAGIHMHIWRMPISSDNNICTWLVVLSFDTKIVIYPIIASY